MYPYWVNYIITNIVVWIICTISQYDRGRKVLPALNSTVVDRLIVIEKKYYWFQLLGIIVEWEKNALYCFSTCENKAVSDVANILNMSMNKKKGSFLL